MPGVKNENNGSSGASEAPLPQMPPPKQPRSSKRGSKKAEADLQRVRQPVDPEIAEATPEEGRAAALVTLRATKMRRFKLNRIEDVSGVSGLGTIAEGIEWSNGKCSINWLTPYECIAYYGTIKALEAVHGHGGSTEIVWIDEDDTGQP